MNDFVMISLLAIVKSVSIHLTYSFIVFVCENIYMLESRDGARETKIIFT